MQSANTPKRRRLDIRSLQGRQHPSVAERHAAEPDAGLPAGLDESTKIFHVSEYQTPELRGELERELRTRDYAYAGMICAAEPAGMPDRATSRSSCRRLGLQHA